MRVSYLLVLAALTAAAPAAAAETVPVAPFKAVELRDGGQVVVRAGAAQRVTIVEGSSRYTRFSVRDGKLLIENCPAHCAREYKLRVEIVTPSIAALAVSDGGSVRTEGAFPVQNAVAAAVREGGIVDARSLPATTVAAAVMSGGRVLVTARTNLVASVNSGGHIMYWGDPSSVTKAIHDGGAVSRGAPGDLRKPVSDFGPRPPAPVSAVPAVPPVPDIEDADDTGDDDEDDSDE